MKKFICSIVVVMLVLPVVACAQVSKSRVVNLVQAYRGCPGFEVVNVGPLGLSLMKALARVSGETEEDEDLALVLQAADGLRGVAIVDYSEASDRDKRKFSEKAAKFFMESEKLVEIKDEGERVLMYGTSDESGKVISDFVLFAPDECALICLFGDIPVETVMKLAEQQ